METKNKDFHLIRTNNGEWISDEYAICNLSKKEVLVYEHTAKKCGLELDVNAGPNGTYWVYKWQVELTETNNYKSKLYGNKTRNQKGI